MELLNAATMLAPLLAWFRHSKKKKNNRLHKLLRVHVPCAMLYHLTNGFFHSTFWLTKCFRVLDVGCIHVSAIAAAKDLYGVFKTSFTRITLKWTYPLHAYSVARSLTQYDVPMLRFGLIVTNNIPIYHFNKKKACKFVLLGLGCFLCFMVSDKFRLGHGLFHIGLYPCYTEFFSMISAAENKSSLLACDSEDLVSTAQ